VLRIRIALTLAFVSLSSLACNKTVKEGDACTQVGEIQCIDDKTGGFCVEGKYEALACEGATGCMSVAGSASCNHSAYKVGEPCFEEGKPECSGDKKAMLECKSNRWVLIDECKGALGCVANAEGAKCDLGAAAAGDACTPENEGNAACTEDKSALLLCKGGTMTVLSTCKGMHGCRQQGTTLDCSSTIADLDDPCDPLGYEGKFACTPDKKTRLVCKEGKMIKDQDCACSVMIDDVSCG